MRQARCLETILLIIILVQPNPLLRDIWFIGARPRMEVFVAGIGISDRIFVQPVSLGQNLSYRSPSERASTVYIFFSSMIRVGDRVMVQFETKHTIGDIQDISLMKIKLNEIEFNKNMISIDR